MKGDVCEAAQARTSPAPAPRPARPAAAAWLAHRAVAPSRAACARCSALLFLSVLAIAEYKASYCGCRTQPACAPARQPRKSTEPRDFYGIRFPKEGLGEQLEPQTLKSRRARFLTSPPRAAVFAQVRAVRNKEADRTDGVRRGGPGKRSHLAKAVCAARSELRQIGHRPTTLLAHFWRCFQAPRRRL